MWTPGILFVTSFVLKDEIHYFALSPKESSGFIPAKHVPSSEEKNLVVINLF